ncbi:DUF6069 family protein [Phytohabitans suffuscus]|uniref:Uncharacterized protein n=1 Tax=Phytohabitans suffuscus TaxID=624315 RepID=A0A6F8Z0G6_9ACTN|nr:DUF6069 family protein [Phytohabitans suffuscus]BCB91809.1 hypothetical protein Psuf_091220 [Phytohabitans suffuscus]
MSAVAPKSSSSPGFAGALRTRPVWLVGILAVLAAAVVTEAFTLVARAAGVPMDAAGVWEEQAQHIPVGYIARSVVIWSIFGVALAVALDRWARRPVRPFVVATVAFTVLSLAAPALAQDTAVSTQIVLAATHVVAASVVVSVLAVRLSARGARR